jgi:uncharacterized membrane protein
MRSYEIVFDHAGEQDQASDLPLRLSAQHRATVRECFMHSTVLVGGGRSPLAFARQRRDTVKIIMASLLVFLCAFGTGTAAHAQGTEWKTLNDEVKSLHRQGRYDQAVVVAKKALQMAEQTVGPNHPAVAESLNNLAALYQAQGQYAEAEPLYKRALAIQEKALGPENPAVAATLGNMAPLLENSREKAVVELDRLPRAATIMKYIFGYGVSLLIGLLVGPLVARLHLRIESQWTIREKPAVRVPWIPWWIGVVERLLYTTCVGFAVAGAGGFIGAWVAVKAAGGWARINEGTTYGRSVYFVGLLGNAASALVGIMGGVIILRW